MNCSLPHSASRTQRQGRSQGEGLSASDRLSVCPMSSGLTRHNTLSLSAYQPTLVAAPDSEVQRIRVVCVFVCVCVCMGRGYRGRAEKEWRWANVHGMYLGTCLHPFPQLQTPHICSGLQSKTQESRAHTHTCNPPPTHPNSPRAHIQPTP